MTPPSARALVAAVAAATLLLGCTATPATLPPVEAAELAPVYDDALDELGVRLTDRGGLVDGDTFEPAPDGSHLSLYVEPVGDRDAAAYVEGLVDVTAVFADDVFDRWPDLASFDVCQEAVGEGEAVTTQVTLTREAAASVDWANATLDELLDVTQRTGSRLVVLDDEVRELARASLEG